MVTPDYRLRLSIGITEKVMTAPSFRYRRDAKDFVPFRAPGVERGKGVSLTDGGDAIILRERWQELAQLQRTENDPDVIKEGDVNLAPGVTMVPSFRAHSDLPGSGETGVVAAGGHTIRKRVRSGQDFSTAALPTDALPQPPFYEPGEESIVPLDRIAEGTASYPENTPFLILLRLPEFDEMGKDGLCNFYFGGNAPVTPMEKQGGHYCLTVRGGGAAILWELEEEPERHWEERRRFALANSDHGNQILIRITPYGRDRIWFRSVATPSPFNSGGFLLGTLLHQLAAQAIIVQKRLWPANLYVCRKEATGHEHQTFSTGAGTIAFDHRRFPRVAALLVRGRFVEEGLYVDSPFDIGKGRPAGTPIKVRLDSYTAAVSGGAAGVTPALYDATTHAVCATDDAGQFLTNGGQSRYYVRMALASTGELTPVIYGFNVDIEPTFEIRTRFPVVASVRGTQITGPDEEPDRESVSLGLTDRLGDLAMLRIQDRHPCRVSIVSRSTGQVISHLFEGETRAAEATRRGTPTHLPDWYDYDVQLSGMGTRVREQFCQHSVLDFTTDPNAPLRPDTTERQRIPWKITDALRMVFKEAGVPEDEVQVPDLSYRFPATDHAEDVTIQFGTDLLEWIVRIARDYLGRAVVRDPNAGERGMWRLLQPPGATAGGDLSGSLATFYSEAPYSQAAPLRVNAFGPASVMFEDNTFKTRIRAPEFSYLTVIGNTSGADSHANLIHGDEIKAAASQDPPHGLGRIVPFTHGPDTALTTLEDVHLMWRRLADGPGKAQKEWRGVAALVLVFDPGDFWQNIDLLRPLRIYDKVTVDGFPAMITSANPTKRSNSDKLWFCDYEGVFLA